MGSYQFHEEDNEDGDVEACGEEQSVQWATKLDDRSIERRGNERKVPKVGRWWMQTRHEEVRPKEHTVEQTHKVERSDSEDAWMHGCMDSSSGGGDDSQRRERRTVEVEDACNGRGERGAIEDHARRRQPVVRLVVDHVAESHLREERRGRRSQLRGRHWMRLIVRSRQWCAARVVA